LGKAKGPRLWSRPFRVFAGSIDVRIANQHIQTQIT